ACFASCGYTTGLTGVRLVLRAPTRYRPAMLIGNTSPPKRPIISITAPMSTSQARIAFNAPLVRAASLQDVPYMAIDWNEERRRVTFISTKSDEYEGHATFPFMRDGGQPSKKAAGKALYVHKQLLSRLHLQAGQYEPTFQRGRAEPRVSIDLEPVAAS